MAIGAQSLKIKGAGRQAQASVDEFMTNPKCMVFVGNMDAAGLGQTLTTAANLDILESDWAPGKNAQAIMRVHRIGQWRNVFVRFITLANSFDLHVNNIVTAKVKAIADIEGFEMSAMAQAA
jgi:SWI/SNF-related matrix-associated actin-dependent regulator 1 of chromatin subfamily A